MHVRSWIARRHPVPLVLAALFVTEGIIAACRDVPMGAAAAGVIAVMLLIHGRR